MKGESKVLKYSEMFLLVLVVFFTIHPIRNYDIWFHLKYGEYIFKTHSLPFTDIFSHTAYGMPAVPYEWLFQVAIYSVFTILGDFGIQMVIIAFTLSYLLLYRKILVKIFHVGVVYRMILISALYILGYNFWMERPQIAAYLLFMMTLYLVLARIYLKQNKLIFTPFILLIWTNLHASMILGLYLLFSFAIFFGLRFIHRREKADWELARDFLIYGLIGFGVTILPPLGTKVYQLLFLFFEKRDFIAKAIDEWVPLYLLSVRYYIYLFIFILAGASLIFARIRKFPKEKLAEFVPFIPLSLFVILGVRHSPFTIPVTFLLLVPAIQTIKPIRSKAVSVICALVILIFSLVGMYSYSNLISSISVEYPERAVSFIRQNLKGKMFNEYEMGGYLMYHLGPEVQTFIDGRTDMFLPQVLPEYINFSWKTYTDDASYLNSFTELVSKYHISWAILTNKRFSFAWRLGRILGNSPAWHLVYFDDTVRIYIADDGVNSEAMGKFAMEAATPLGKSIYRTGAKEEARHEYEKMYSLNKSAIAANALGFILLEDGKYEEAKNYFLEALKFDSKAAAPKMNLAELAASDADYQQATSLYRQAIKDESDRGLAYLRLGQLIIESGGSKEEARKILQKGLNATPDEEILNKLQKELDDI